MSETLNGQILGQAEHATRAVLDKLLADNDTTFHQWVTLNLLTISGSTLDEDTLVERMTHGLKVDAWVALDAVRDLTELGHVTVEETVVSVTTSGEALFQTVRGGIDGIAERLYGGMPTEDLAIAARVLTTLTARANAELAA